MMNGFIIEQLKLTGDGVADAIITFKEGLNVISGPSNTGKTFVFQCINYMLGSTNPPKNIREARDYSKIFLQIKSHNNKVFLLESDLKGGNFKLYSKDGKGQPEILHRKHDPEREDNISAFLLKLTGLHNKKVRTNGKGKTRKMSYRDVVKFLLVDESKITTDKSPILSGQYTTATEEEGVFKFILSGKDDSDIIESLNVKEVTNRKGRADLLEELIYGLRVEINTVGGSGDYKEQLERADRMLSRLEPQQHAFQEMVSHLERKRNMVVDSLNDLKSRRIYLEELLLRTAILKNQYQVDRDRLNATIEASELLLENPTVASSCPVCNNEINYPESENGIQQVLLSCQNEILKIETLQYELLESERLINIEREEASKEIAENEAELKDVERRLKDEVSEGLNFILSRVRQLNDQKSNLLQIKLLSDKLDAYEKQKSDLERVIAAAGKQREYTGVSTSLVTPLSQIMLKILSSCNYPDLNGVAFSEEKLDFVISGENRDLAGKGYRAITYAAFIIALQELTFQSNYSLGVPVLDSPLVTYRKPSAQNQGITIDLAMDFYRYVAFDRQLTQCIILENEEPPADISNNINHIRFTQSRTVGRYGFIPIA